jgi:hypothetical protein
MRIVLAANTSQTSRLMNLTEVWHGFVDNLIHRIIYRVPEQMLPGLWAAHWQDWFGAPLLAIALTVALGLAALPRRAAALPLFFTLAPYFLVLFVFPFGGSVRYWVPVTSLLGLLIVTGIAPVWARLRPAVRWRLLCGITIVYSVNLAVFARDFNVHPYLGDLGDMVALFDRVRSLPQPPAATLAQHFLAFTLETGDASPMDVPSRGLDPRYTDLITRDQPTDYAHAWPVPPGARDVLGVGAWHLYALPEAMTVAQINGTTP